MERVKRQFKWLGQSERRPETPSILLNQTTDVLLQIALHLDDASAICLSLTCKDVFALLDEVKPCCRRNLSSQDRETLLQLLEKDPSIGDKFYFCHHCNKLHPFSVSKKPWVPDGNKLQLRSYLWNRKRQQLVHRHAKSEHALFGYAHARLVMNRHFYGAPCGLPLDILMMDRPICKLKGAGLLDQFTTAKIIDDQLFLTYTQKFTLKTANVSPEELWYIFCNSQLQICNHVDYNRVTRPYNSLVEDTRVDPSANGKIAFPNTEDIRCGFCKHCLTDFEAILHKEGGHGAGSEAWCSVTITSYHQLGRCRMQRNPEALGVFSKNESGMYIRDLILDAPGAIRNRWLDGTEVSGE
ncbi:hypothetical protein PT974_07054 [Cladobotryum mycophilum]|uniref:F-box domain-containing protein n=1 Tax=Cladobotryum mycophilum TaxID=491253 RepID=A0ABR0SPE4_9HYPO